MSPTPATGPAAGSHSSHQVWFLDTSALVTLAVHPPLQRTVAAVLLPQRRVLIKAVVAELKGLASTKPPVAHWAAAALGQLDWLGEPVGLDDPVGTDLAVKIQEKLAAGRPLKHDAEHYGEAAIIALASRARKLTPLMLSDDYDARIAALTYNIRSLSVHRLLHVMITKGKIIETDAAAFAHALFSAGRSPDYTTAELASGRLGRVGQP